MKKIRLLRNSAAVLLAGAAMAAGVNAMAGELTRHKLPGSDFPILMAVEVPTGYKTIYLSGVVASVADAAKPPGTIEAYGDTKTQTVSVLQNIERNLKRLNLSMSDVVKMQVFLVGDPKLQGKMDFKGLMEGYTQFFGTKEQPNLPTRSVMQVSALANAGWLVEIAVVAASAKKAPAAPRSSPPGPTRASAGFPAEQARGPPSRPGLGAA